MSSLLIRDVRIVEPGQRVHIGDVLVRDGVIASVGSVPTDLRANATRIEGHGRLLTPGLIDVHTHGLMHSLYETGPDGLRAAARELGRFGVTTVVPTIVPQIRDGWIEHLGAIAAAIPSVLEVHIPGLHIEGPFMAVGGAACPTLPGDLDLVERILTACAGRIAVMSVSPDTPNIVPVIRRLRERAITVFVTHTRANVEQTEAALAAGASHATHFYDVFPLPAETEPGARPVEIQLSHTGNDCLVSIFVTFKDKCGVFVRNFPECNHKFVLVYVPFRLNCD